jgi:DHA2 family multidrug resistance protein
MNPGRRRRRVNQSLEAAPQQGGILSLTGQQWLIMAMVALANMLFNMTITLANLVLPQVRGTLSATQDEIAWVITLNLMATAIATPLTAWLAGRIGWRNMMLWSVGGFTFASMLCGLAYSLETLIIARVMQGAFGAPIAPLGQAILLATFPRHLQPFALVMWGVGSVFGPVVGPIVGAMASDAWNWRAAFFIIVPPGIASLVCIWFALREHRSTEAIRFDWIGFLALAIALVCAQLIFDRGQRMDWFDAPEIVLCALVGLLAFWVFVVHCLTSDKPFLDPRILLDRNFAVGTLIAFVVGMLSFTSLVLFPTLLHDLRGYPEHAISVLISARGLGNWTAFLFITPLTRIAPRFAIGTGLAIQAAGGFWMGQFDINVSHADIFWSHYLMGLGNSVAFTPMAVMAFSTLPRHRIAEGVAVFTMMRNFGSSLFISMAILVLVRSSSINYAQLTEFVTLYRPFVTEATLPAVWNPDTAAGLMGLSREVQRQAAMIGYINAFYLMGFVGALAVPLAVCLRRVPSPQR